MANMHDLAAHLRDVARSVGLDPDPFIMSRDEINRVHDECAQPLPRNELALHGAIDARRNAETGVWEFA